MKIDGGLVELRHEDGLPGLYSRPIGLGSVMDLFIAQPTDLTVPYPARILNSA